MSARQHVASADLPSGSSVDAWTAPAVSPEHIYQTMPPLAQDDADALERSIRTHGIQTPIIVDEHGNILDGHHRREIATRCGLPLPVEVRRDLDEATKIALSISLNVDRRQLTAAQKREIIAASLKAAPESSDNSIAKTVGVHNETVTAVRKKLEATGDVTESVTRTDTLGRRQPATKQSNVTSITKRRSESETVTVPANVDLATGEIAEESSAVAAYLDADQSLQDRKYVTAFVKALNVDWLQFDAERIAAIADPDVIKQIELTTASVVKFAETIKRNRPGLRAL